MSDTKIEFDENSFLGDGDESDGHSVEIHDEHEPSRTAKTKADRLEAGGDASAPRPAGRPRTWLVVCAAGALRGSAAGRPIGFGLPDTRAPTTPSSPATSCRSALAWQATWPRSA